MKKNNNPRIVSISELNSDLERELYRYLIMDTSYAFMIVGPWGSGKSFYFDNILVPSVIHKTPVFNNDKYEYKSVRISLFGIESIDQLYLEFISAIYPWLKSKTVRIGTPILKILARAIIYSRNKGLTNIDDYEKELGKIPKEVSPTERIVICFDDLERKDDKFSLKSLIGFINTLVENNNIKVVILSNENKIEEDEYFKFKEKVVGITIPFERNTRDVINDIVSKRYSVFENFKLKIDENSVVSG